MKNIASNAPSQLYPKREAILDIKCVNNEKAEHREDGRVFFFPLDLFFSYMEKDGEQFNCIPTTGSDLLWVSKKNKDAPSTPMALNKFKSNNNARITSF